MVLSSLVGKLPSITAVHLLKPSSHLCWWSSFFRRQPFCKTPTPECPLVFFGLLLLRKVRSQPGGERVDNLLLQPCQNQKRAATLRNGGCYVPFNSFPLITPPWTEGMPRFVCIFKGLSNLKWDLSSPPLLQCEKQLLFLYCNVLLQIGLIMALQMLHIAPGNMTNKEEMPSGSIWKA